jgi:uncharacterized protein YlxW (UPF0749 family)
MYGKFPEYGRTNKITDNQNKSVPVFLLFTNHRNPELCGTNLKTRVANLKTRVVNLKTRVANLKTRVANLETRVANLKTRVANLETRVANLKTRVVNLKTRVANRGSFIRNFHIAVSMQFCFHIFFKTVLLQWPGPIIR